MPPPRWWVELFLALLADLWESAFVITLIVVALLTWWPGLR